MSPRTMRYLTAEGVRGMRRHRGLTVTAVVTMTASLLVLGVFLITSYNVKEVIKELDGIAVVTADHGNADVMFTFDKTGGKRVRTAHSLNPVPFVIYDPKYGGEYEMVHLERPGLSNVASTLLNLLGFEKVKDYDPSLIRVK